MSNETFDNITKILKDDLSSEIKEKANISVSANCFSIYAYQELRKELNKVKSFRFIFTSPTFLNEKTPKEKREFFIPRLERERNIYGTKYEVKLRNELKQKAIAKECIEWIRTKARFKSNKHPDYMSTYMIIQNQDKMPILYNQIIDFTTTSLGVENSNIDYCISKIENDRVLKRFDENWNDKDKLQDVTEEVINNIETIYNENSPEFIYFFTLYNLFKDYIENLDEDTLPNEAVGFKKSKIWNKLYDFQKTASLSIINKLEKYNACILADSVGLGKTFTALSVIKYYENRNKDVLVLCPKKLYNNWDSYKHNYKNNPLLGDRFNYTVLFHSDLTRKKGISESGVDLSRINWSNFDLVVIDESHNFRNGGSSYLTEENELKYNRYNILLNKVIKEGVKTKVLMLSATPVNNRFTDLKNQLKLAYEDEEGNDRIDKVLKQAQQRFNEWSKKKNGTTQDLINSLDEDFFKLLDDVTISRSRKNIEKFYNIDDIGRFPKRLKPINESPTLTINQDDINYNEIIQDLMDLTLCVYNPTSFLLPSRVEKYNKNENDKIKQSDREKGLVKLMSINLLKRMESSVFSFNQTLQTIIKKIDYTLKTINDFLNKKEELDAFSITKDVFSSQFNNYSLNNEDFNDLDYEDSNNMTIINNKMEIDLADIDCYSWQANLEKDKQILESLYNSTSLINKDKDYKLHKLKETINNKINNPINKNNKKIIIFTAFSDTAIYLYDNLVNYIKDNFNLNTALITGNTIKTNANKVNNDINSILTEFSPISKERDLLQQDNEDIDILIATDCISEGQNLQDCDYLINYDIHWNPVRLIQRFGRIDRIGSKNEVIQMVNFWPPVELDDYIKLKDKLTNKMAGVISVSNDDNINEEEIELEYRKKQLEKIKNEVVDLEEIDNNISIMDLGFNDFRLELIDYIKKHPSIEKTPNGMNTVIEANEEMPAGVIYLLKSENESNNQNILDPYYLIYIKNNGEIFYDYLKTKDLLDKLRLYCSGKDVNKKLCKVFNEKTNDGKKMDFYSKLLEKSIESIVEIKDKKDVDSLFSSGGTTINKLKSLNDFELICFFVIEEDLC